MSDLRNDLVAFVKIATDMVMHPWQERILHDYGTIMLCPCGWRGPYYLLRPARKYPGMAHCPKCDRDAVKVEAKK